MADEYTERRRTLILRRIVRQWNEKEKADNGAVCSSYSSMCCNMFRLHWVENGQVSSFSLAGKHLRMLNTLTQCMN